MSNAILETRMRIRAYVDRCDSSRAAGWIFNPDEPSQKFTIEIIGAGQILGAVPATRHRPDLAMAGYGAGDCAFLFEMPPQLPDAAMQDIRLRVQNTDLYLLPPLAKTSQSGGFRTRYGGLWVDRLDWIDVLGERHRRGLIDDATADAICRYVRDGFAIFRAAVPKPLVDALNDEIDSAWADPPAGLWAETLEPHGDAFLVEPAPRHARGRARLRDLYTVSAHAREAATQHAAKRFIAALLDDTPKVFAQSAVERGMHMEWVSDRLAETIPSNPLCQVTSFIALDSIGTGDGELLALTGSHHAPATPSSHASPFESESERRTRISDALIEGAVKFGHRQAPLLAEPGDLMVRHPDLAYADAAPTTPGQRRRALLTHFTRAAIDPFDGEEIKHGELQAPDCVFVSRHGGVV